MKAYRLLTLAVCAAATIPRLAHRGMFVDGVTYASIARNLAEGRGTLWSPSYTATIYPEFYEHPPLGFWLESLWFRVAGDHLFVERAYSIAAATLTIVLIVLLWRSLERGRPNQTLDWLPVAFWIAAPLVSWTIVGNLLETTVAVFTTASVLAIVEALDAPSLGASAAWGALSGMAVGAAVLTKGPVGLFPLVAPVFLFFSRAATRRGSWPAVVAAAAQWIALAVCALAVLAWPPAHHNVNRYVAEQLLPSISGQREVSLSSLTILGVLGRGVLLPLAGVSVVFVLAARRFAVPDQRQRRRSLVFLALALAGTLPIAISPKQAGHYLVPAIPLYAISAASLLAATAGAAVERVKTARGGRLVVALAVLLAAVAVFLSLLPSLGRDRQRLADLDALANVVPRGETIGICPEVNGDWGLHASFARLFEVSLDARHKDTAGWFLASRAGSPACAAPVGCTAVSDSTRDLVLMQCK